MHITEILNRTIELFVMSCRTGVRRHTADIVQYITWTYSSFNVLQSLLILPSPLSISTPVHMNRLDKRCLDTKLCILIFTELHRMPARTSHEQGGCQSVCQTRDLWQNERKLCPHSYTTRKIIYPSFVIRRTVLGGDPFFSVKLFPLERNRRFLVDIRS